MPEDQTPDATEQPEQPAQDLEQHDSDDLNKWKAEARKWEARARQNNGKATAAEQQADQFKTAIAQALGIEKPDDPKKLADNLTAAQREAAEASRQLAVYRAAARNGANPDALVDSASFLRSIAQIDPSDADAIASAIKQAVEQNPALGNGQTPGAGFRDATAGRNSKPADSDLNALRLLGFA